MFAGVDSAVFEFALAAAVAAALSVCLLAFAVGALVGAVRGSDTSGAGRVTLVVSLGVCALNGIALGMHAYGVLRLELCLAITSLVSVAALSWLSWRAVRS